MKGTKPLDLACTCLMVVLIFISIENICDLEMGLANFSDWSLLQEAILCSRRFAFEIVLTNS